MKREEILDRGYTIDENGLVGACPDCGMNVYHVKENPYTCFCLSPSCHFASSTVRPNEVSSRIRSSLDIARYKTLEECFISGRTIYFCKNSKMHESLHPVIIFDDVINYRFWIRAYDGPIDVLLNDSSLPVIRHYLSIADIVEDGWELE